MEEKKWELLNKHLKEYHSANSECRKEEKAREIYQFIWGFDFTTKSSESPIYSNVFLNSEVYRFISRNRDWLKMVRGYYEGEYEIDDLALAEWLYDKFTEKKGELIKFFFRYYQIKENLVSYFTTILHHLVYDISDTTYLRRLKKNFKTKKIDDPKAKKKYKEDFYDFIHEENIDLKDEKNYNKEGYLSPKYMKDIVSSFLKKKGYDFVEPYILSSILMRSIKIEKEYIDDYNGDEDENLNREDIEDIREQVIYKYDLSQENCFRELDALIKEEVIIKLFSKIPGKSWRRIKNLSEYIKLHLCFFDLSAEKFIERFSCIFKVFGISKRGHATISRERKELRYVLKLLLSFEEEMEFKRVQKLFSPIAFRECLRKMEFRWERVKKAICD